jgi:hypothetical protein
MDPNGICASCQDTGKHNRAVQSFVTGQGWLFSYTVKRAIVSQPQLTFESIETNGVEPRAYFSTVF